MASTGPGEVHRPSLPGWLLEVHSVGLGREHKVGFNDLRGPLKRAWSAPLKGIGVDIRQVQSKNLMVLSGNPGPYSKLYGFLESPNLRCHH